MAVALFACSSLDREFDTCETLNLPNCNPPSGSAGSNGSGGTEGDEPEPSGEMPEEWQCLTQPDMPPPVEATPTTRVTYLTPVVDFDSPSPVSPVPVPGLQLTVCTSPSCNPPAFCWPDNTACDPDIADVPVVPPENSPVGVAQPNQTAAPFLYAVSLPLGYDAVSIRARAPGFVPSEYFVGGPMRGSPEGGTIVVGLPYFLLKESALNALYTQVELPTPWDTSRGILAVRTINCDRSPTPFAPMDPTARQATRGQRVRLEMLPTDPALPAVPWVLSFGKRATKTILETDDRGTAGFANLRAGDYLVRGRAPAPIGAEEGMPYGQTPVTVRGGIITIIEIRDGLNVWGQ